MVTLREITENNFDECIHLEVEDNQKSFVARNTYSLAQAWLYPANARPFSIYHDDAAVGFLMLDIDCHNDGSKRACGLWRLMIDKKYQGRGYGKAAMRLAITYVTENLAPEEMRTSFVPGNETAEKLYKSLGFVATGELDDGEIVMVLRF